MTRDKSTRTIAQVLEEFLADQKARTSHKTYLKYQSIIGLYKSYLESYWPGHDGEYDKITKAFGEALGALYAEKYGLAVLCLRIGNVGDQPIDQRRLSIWLKPEDLVQLVRIGLEHPGLHFEVFYGASFNERAWWDNSKAYSYGYRPTGRAEDFRDAALAAQAKLPPDPVGDFYQGGTFCSDEFGGDAAPIWRPGKK